MSQPRDPLDGYVMAAPPGVRADTLSSVDAAASNVIPFPASRIVRPVEETAEALARTNGHLQTAEVVAPLVVDGAARAGLMGAATKTFGRLGNLGVVGAVAGTGVSLLTARHQQNMAEIDLKNQFGAMVAEELGIPIEKVTIEDIRKVAEHNEILKLELLRIEKEASHHVVGSLVTGLAGAGAWALAAVAAPALAIPAGIFAGAFALAGSIAASYGAGAVLDAVTGAPQLDKTGVGAIRELSAKMAEGGQASIADVVKVFALGKKELAESILAETGASYPTKAIEDMTPEEQRNLQNIIAAHPKLAAVAAHYAGMINAHTMQPEMLAAINPLQAMGLEPVRIAGGRAQLQPPPAPVEATPKSFAAAELSRRAQANDNQLGGQSGLAVG